MTYSSLGFVWSTEASLEVGWGPPPRRKMETSLFKKRNFLIRIHR